MVILKIWEEGDYLYVDGTKEEQDRLLEIIRVDCEDPLIEWEDKNE